MAATEPHLFAAAVQAAAEEQVPAEDRTSTVVTTTIDERTQLDVDVGSLDMGYGPDRVLVVTSARAAACDGIDGTCYASLVERRRRGLQTSSTVATIAASRVYVVSTSANASVPLSDLLNHGLASVGASVTAATTEALSASTTVSTTGNPSSSTVGDAFASRLLFDEIMTLRLPGIESSVTPLVFVLPPPPPSPPPLPLVPPPSTPGLPPSTPSPIQSPTNGTTPGGASEPLEPLEPDAHIGVSSTVLGLGIALAAVVCWLVGFVCAKRYRHGTTRWAALKRQRDAARVQPHNVVEPSTSKCSGSLPPEASKSCDGGEEGRRTRIAPPSFDSQYERVDMTEADEAGREKARASAHYPLHVVTATRGMQRAEADTQQDASLASSHPAPPPPPMRQLRSLSGAPSLESPQSAQSPEQTRTKVPHNSKSSVAATINRSTSGRLVVAPSAPALCEAGRATAASISRSVSSSRFPITPASYADDQATPGASSFSSPNRSAKRIAPLLSTSTSLSAVSVAAHLHQHHKALHAKQALSSSAAGSCASCAGAPSPPSPPPQRIAPSLSTSTSLSAVSAAAHLHQHHEALQGRQVSSSSVWLLQAPLRSVSQLTHKRPR